VLFTEIAFVAPAESVPAFTIVSPLYVFPVLVRVQIPDPFFVTEVIPPAPSVIAPPNVEIDELVVDKTRVRGPDPVKEIVPLLSKADVPAT
jgi:hypothetical protein